MNFRDRWEKNENGEDFIFTVEMQRRLSQAGLPVEPASLSQISVTPEATQPKTESKTESVEESVTETTSQPASTPKEDLNTFAIQIDPQTGKYIGRMKWYNPRKGYGFLIRGAGEEIFFHKSNTVGNAEELKEGDWVLYDIEETRKGPEATEIEPYSGDTESIL
jgi:CspA family cold shock protein